MSCYFAYQFYNSVMLTVYGKFKTSLTSIDSPSGIVIVHSLELSQLPKWTQTNLLLRD